MIDKKIFRDWKTPWNISMSLRYASRIECPLRRFLNLKLNKPRDRHDGILEKTAFLNILTKLWTS